MGYQWQRQVLHHSGGTKFYEAVYIADNTGKTSVGLCIKRWGPIGKKGQVKIESGSIGYANQQYGEILTQKRQRGYTDRRIKDSQELDAEALLRDVAVLFDADTLDQVRLKFGLGDVDDDPDMDDPFDAVAAPDPENFSPAKEEATPPAPPDEWGTW